MFWSRLATLNNPVWSQFHDLQGEVNRLFDQWGDRGRHLLGLASFPAINIWEDGDALLVETELPGMALTDLEIYVTGHNQLTIKGERKAPVLDKAVQHRQERSYGTFMRALTLPAAVDENQIDARFENGVLHGCRVKQTGRTVQIEIRA